MQADVFKTLDISSNMVITAKKKYELDRVKIAHVEETRSGSNRTTEAARQSVRDHIRSFPKVSYISS